MLLLLLACQPQEPVLSGITPPGELEASGEDPGVYLKGEGVYVDAQYIAGKNWEVIRDVVNAQMGDVQEIQDLGRDGRELTLEKGFVREHEGQVYLVHVDLPRAMRRTAALHATGLPPQADDWHSFTHEYRLRWHGNFDRIRMGRIQADAEMVTWVEAKRYDPRSALQQ